MRDFKVLEGDLSQLASSKTAAGTAEWALLVECARPGTDTKRLMQLLRPSVSWPAVFELAEKHGLLGLLAFRLRDLGEAAVSPEISLELRRRSRAHALFTLRLTAELFRLFQNFGASDLEALVIKGPALSVRCYGDPGVRHYSDLDLIVRDKDMLRSTELMIRLGYQPRVPPAAILAKKAPGEYAFWRPGTELLVEFHTERTFRYHPRPPSMENIFKRQSRVELDARDIPVLSPEDELLLICIHGAKHFWERLSYIADVAALVSRQELDWGRLGLVLEELAAQRMLYLGLRLAEDVLGAPIPDIFAAAVRRDAGITRLTQQVTQKLPAARPAPPGICERAVFRMRMHGSLPYGLAYLARLSLSPTEDDWIEGAGNTRHWLLDALGRPIRLARKHGRSGKT